jgi:hypothetical protein
MWELEGRDDILEWVDTIQLGDDHCVHDIWISPVTHDDVKRCPWLRKLPNQDRYVCRIHDVKPEHYEQGVRDLMIELLEGCDYRRIARPFWEIIHTLIFMTIFGNLHLQDHSDT